MDSPFRNRSVEAILKFFEDMRKGKFEEGKATLRMKMNMQAENTVMRDLIAYRIKYSPHPHTGDKWCIYPSYDYTHCIIDSLENITHSLCTLEFAVRRESYYWLLDALELYKPIVWEYSRLNITHMVMSKRKLTKLVKEGHIRGWDDPRLMSLVGMRRRGYTPAAINDFCDRIGVTRNDCISHPVELLEECVRNDLNIVCDRRLVVLKPLLVKISNWTGNNVVEVPNYPNKPERGSRKVSLSSILYIDSEDFKKQDEKGYKRLAPGATVGLLHCGATITCSNFKEANGEVIEIDVIIDFNPKEKARGYIHWVDKNNCVPLELRLYDRLFISPDPSSLDNFIDDLNRDSLKILHGFGEINLRDSKPESKYQFERLGYFCCDVESKINHLVFNKTVSLKESKEKV